MEKLLINKIKQMKGTTICIGVDSDQIKGAIEKNNDIDKCYLLDEMGRGYSKKKLHLTGRTQTVNIKKIRKVFKKKRIENLICNYSLIKPFMKTFTKDSVYINKGKLYIYGNKEDLTETINKYKRYTDKIELKENSKAFLLIIDNTNTTNNKIKDTFYFIKDALNELLDILTNILVN